MIKQKQRELISLLIRSKNGFKSSQELAEELSLSDRTVRTYLKDLKTLIERNGGNIVSKQGYGFQLEIFDRTVFNLFLIEHHLLDKNIEQSQCREASERKHYILNLLLLESQKIDVEALSEQLFISSSQLNKDIAEIKSQLQPYELTLKKSHSLIYVDGEERAKRHFIMSYFFHEDSINFLHHLSYFNQTCEAISFDTLTIIILDECREANIKLSDVMIQNIVLHLSLSIKRLQSGLSIQNLDLLVSADSTIEYQVAKRIITRIESIIGFHFPKEEQMYLTLHLMSKSNLIQNDLDEELGSSLTNLLLKIEQETGYPFWHDEQLKNGLIQHLKPMLVRLAQNIKLENPLIDEIKSQYGEVFGLVKHYFNQLPNLNKYDVIDDEWGYLALHFLASLEKLKNEQKAKVLIICATGLGSAQLLKNRVESEFDERVKIIATRGYYEIEQEMLNDIDFIISSVDLSSKVFKVPVFHVSVFFCEEDVQAIRRYLSHRQIPNSSLPKNSLPIDDKKKNHSKYIAQVFDEIAADYFYLCSNKPTKQAVLDHLLDSLSINESKNFKQEMKKQMEKRMTLGEIIFSPTIVVPHPAIPVGKIAKIAIAVIPEGVSWDINYQDVKFIFMISPSIYQNSNLAMMTKAIVNLIDDLAMQNAMLKITDFNQFKSYFIQLIEKGA
ncbi:transcription antiterminator BglG [Gilliamella sp. wkB72]|uniref:BglG family transcription antiterminator n=1 Tax=Gilliamella sp. wkB72 TaxID=3120265 RepID=UPI000810E856|nr:transcription antiterminator [Gilliamella apicola]OCL22918.1 transcription antiterminator BglG [Gilliamella apicola]